MVSLEQKILLPSVVGTHSYIPTGIVKRIEELEVYETGLKETENVIILAYDIFGITGNIQQVADIISKAGYKVIIPDFFRGRKVIYLMKQLVRDFVTKHGNWNKTVKLDIKAVVKHYTELGAKTFGILGLGWGSKIAINSAREVPDIQALAIISPSFVNIEDSKGIKIPTLIIPSKDDFNMIPFYNILRKNVGQEKVLHYRVNDMPHGFAGARGDFAKIINQKRVNEVLSLVVKFYSNHIQTSEIAEEIL